MFFTSLVKKIKYLLSEINNIFGDNKVSDNFSDSILEGVNLLVVEVLEEISTKQIERIANLEYVNEVKFADRL